MTTTILAFTIGALCGGSISFMALALLIAEDNGRYSQFSANRYRHHKPDTFASIIEDAIGDRIEDRAEFDRELDALVARCKALAGDAE